MDIKKTDLAAEKNQAKQTMERFRRLRDNKQRTADEQKEYELLKAQYPNFVLAAGFNVGLKNPADAERVQTLNKRTGHQANERGCE